MEGADVDWVLKGTGNLSRGTAATGSSANSLGGGDMGSRVRAIYIESTRSRSL